MVRWAEQALERLAEIEDFVAARNPAAASRLIERLVQRGESLGKFPHRGRSVPELPLSPLRELVVGNYRLVYWIHSGSVEIITVFEAHRRIPRTDLP